MLISIDGTLKDVFNILVQIKYPKESPIFPVARAMQAEVLKSQQKANQIYRDQVDKMAAFPTKKKRK